MTREEAERVARARRQQRKRARRAAARWAWVYHTPRRMAGGFRY